MKPFNLEEYKKNPSREVVTRDGHKARIICTDMMCDYPIVALILVDSKETPRIYTELGHYNHGSAEPLDLFFVSFKRKGWINIYKDNNRIEGFHGETIYETEEGARYASRGVTSYVATVPVEWEE